MSKTLCELKKVLKADLLAFVLLVENPTHICRKCGRMANDKHRLCKPAKLAPLRRKACLGECGDCPVEPAAALPSQPR